MMLWLYIFYIFLFLIYLYLHIYVFQSVSPQVIFLAFHEGGYCVKKCLWCLPLYLFICKLTSYSPIDFKVLERREGWQKLDFSVVFSYFTPNFACFFYSVLLKLTIEITGKQIP